MIDDFVTDFVAAMRARGLEPPPLLPVRPHLRRVPRRPQLRYAEAFALMLVALGGSSTDLPLALAERLSWVGQA
jgi:hypothetical protein